jgi:transposase
VIGYETYCQIRLLHGERGLSFAQIGAELGIDPETAAKYLRAGSYQPRRRAAKRPSKLDPFKPAITRWLERHPYTAVQILQRLRAEQGYEGGYGILKNYVHAVRPVRHPAYLTLAFAPGEAAQVDWGCAGTLGVGATRRRLSFFLMVLCHSRLLYLEFTLGEALEHFLACHQNALEFFGGTPATILIDNLKTGVLCHPVGEKATFHPRYLDFAACHGFSPRACNVRKANEKGRVENAVGYVKKNFLAGLELPDSLAALNTAARRWMDEVANVRLHGETRQTPATLFAAQEKAALRPLPALPADTGVVRSVRATNRCRVVVDTNRYSVPSLYASQRLTLKLFADRLCLYHGVNLVATWPRRYERHRDFENPDHVRELLEQRRNAREAKVLLAFYALSPRAEEYHQRLCERRLHARTHLTKIVALADIYGPDKVARALEDAFTFEAFSSEYIANLLEQRARLAPAPGPLHLTRRADLLEVELGPADLSLYETENINPPPHPS